MMKVQYDMGTKCREFSIGSQVLVWTLDLTGSLAETWEGPYEIVRKISDVNMNWLYLADGNTCKFSQGLGDT